VGIDCNIYKIAGRIVVNKYADEMEETILQHLTKIFGIYSISPCVTLPTSKENIVAHLQTLNFAPQTFRVNVNRADKTFPVKSLDFERELGGVLLKNNEGLKVNLTQPQLTVSVDIRENGETFIFHQIIKGSGGMPAGTSGKAMLLLSGGIDSPVAGYQMAKRGLTIEAVHFHSFPYTSEQAKQKVITLAKILSEYAGTIKLYVVPFTKIQEEIHKNCNNEFMITLMRRFMMRIAERLAISNGDGAIITGESLAQVASQTMQSITATNHVINDIPVFRPLIGLDKEDIIEVARKINTFETSILPYEDCFTVFLPKNPVIKPKLEKVQKEESYLDMEVLIAEAIAQTETMLIKNN
jgi:thiamine biosynthesis protein ThiI